MTENSSGRTKKIIAIAVAVLAIIIAAALIIPRIYAANESSDVAAPSLSTSSSTAATATTDAATDINGAWTVSTGSYAGYRVNEVLNGADVTVVGRTETVTGDASVDNNTLNSGSITVDLASVTTDSDRRDNYFRTQAIDTTANPSAVFTITEPASLEGLGSDPIDVTVQGDLTINGVTQPASATLQVAVVNGEINAAGSIPITWSDFGVEAPNLGFVAVEDAGTLEFLVVLAK